MTSGHVWLYLVSVNVRRDRFGEEIRAHSTRLQVEVHGSRVLVCHCAEQAKNHSVIHYITNSYLSGCDP